MTKKTQLLTGITVLSVLGAGIIAGLTVTSSANGLINNDEATAAIESGDIEAFRQAIIDKGNKRAQRRAENLNEEKFAEIQAKYKSKQTIESAIENGDYTAFQEAVDGLERVPRKFKEIQSEEDFQELVANKAQLDVFQDELTTAAQNEDKEAFTATLLEAQEFIQANRPEDAPAKDFKLTDKMIDKAYEKALEQVAEGEEVELLPKGNRGHAKRVLRR